MDRATLIGRQLGSYRIISLLGAGGMGEVYRAHDARLGRDVAIKVLPAAYAADAERLGRFQREARLLATVNHPNIASIYDFEESGDLTAIVLELIEGPTLADRLRARQPLDVVEALTVARDIAEALDAAHARGIIHRDLKPANIKVTSAGVVKLLDFGLAKAWTADLAAAQTAEAATVTAIATREGTFVGTAAYMSPEQARGRSVDQRTDVWAFGCVLFEMLSGQSPFAGATLPDTIARVLERDPDWSALRASTPARVRDLLRRCLQKDPERRLGDFADARRDLDASLESPFRTLRAGIESVRWQVGRPAGRVVIAGATIAAAAALFLRLDDRPAPIPQLVNPVQITSAVGVEDHPTWSPDNRTLGYESNESGNWDIWLVQVGGQAVNRTGDHRGADRYPSWSPDGRQIAFWSEREEGGYFVAPALGGPAVKMIATPATSETYHSPPEWSADGTQLAGVVYVVDSARFEQWVEIVSVITRDARRVRLPGTEEARLDLTWSRDGQYLAYVEGGQQQSEVTQLHVLRLADGVSTPLTNARTNVRRPRWSNDGRSLYYICNCAGPMDVWRQRMTSDGVAQGEPERVTNGLEVRDIAFSPDGSRLAYSKGRWVSNFWRVPIVEDRDATWADAQQVTFDQAYVEFLDVSPDGTRVAYSSDRSGNQDLWIMPLGGDPTQLTRDPAPDWAPSWSPDGREIVFYSYRTGDREIWKMPAAGGAAIQLTRSSALDAAPQWSPDGRDITFRSERTGNSEIWIIDADGSTPRQVTHHPASDALATWSPDGQWLAFSSNRGGERQIWRVPSVGGEAQRLTAGPGMGPRWSRDGRFVYYEGIGASAGNLWRYSLKDGTERRVTNLIGRRGTLGIMQPALDDRFVYFPWRDDLGDIWVMEVAQQR